MLYQNYIIKSLLPPFIMIAFSLTALVWITQILKFLHLFEKGIKLSHFFSLTVLVVPSLLYILLPFITLIAVIYTYNYLSERRQLIILQSSGLSNMQLAMPALFFACVIMLGSYYLSASLLPLSYNKLKSNLDFIRNNYVTSIIEEKTFAKVAKGVSLYIDRKLADGRMEGMVLFDNRKPGAEAILFARSGTLKLYNNNPVFELNEGLRQAYDVNGNLTKLSFNSLIVDLVNNGSKKNEDRFNRDINEYYISELFYPDYRLSKQKKIKLIAEGHQRIIWPLFNFLFAFLALAVFLKQPYNKRSSLKHLLFTSLSVIIVTYLHFTLQNKSTKDLIYIFICYLNIIITFIISLYLYLRKTI